jgi:site-specific DNA-methyltransferase (adenine-specific)
MKHQNALYYGDNLDILRDYIPDESIDLIYLDPPFNSNQVYNIIYKEQNGSPSQSQIKAFEDTWKWDETVARAYQEVVESGNNKVARSMIAFREMLGECNLLAYLTMMAPRLVEMYRVLTKTGSIYLHCDQTASHYLKLILDTIFETKNFRNEITWCYTGASSPGQRQFPRKHDVIFWYSKGDKWVFNDDEIRIPYSESTISRIKAGDKGGKSSQSVFHGKRINRTAHEKGKIIEDWWIIPPLGSTSKERLGYPTQKPEALLERIIKASSSEGDVILDPFCGCGTAVVVAEKLKRKWIGIDITNVAISLVINRLDDAFIKATKFQVIGVPVSLSDARALAESDPFEFQYWATGMVGAFPTTKKKGADRGIDGTIRFHDEGLKGKTKKLLISVKSGKVGVKDIRNLRGVIEREGAEIGVFITLATPTRNMITEATTAGFYTSPGWNTKHSRIQILTIEEILSGKRIDYPSPQMTNVTFKRAPFITKSTNENQVDFSE